jgi:hypothetical protein
MESTLNIRAATPSDVEAISLAIIRALHETNAQDYPPHVIAAVAENFSRSMWRRRLPFGKLT